MNLQNLLSLNPKTKPFANVLPSAQTKDNKLKWKRNVDRKCDVSTNYVHPFVYARYDFGRDRFYSVNM